MDIKRIACPSCGGNQFEHDAEGNLICQFCGAQYESPREELLCQVCGTLNPAQARRCMNCGLVLGRQCPVCAHINEPGADHCEECATPLDTLAALTTRSQTLDDGRLSARSERMVTTKAADLTYMAEQRARLEAEEHERLARLVERRARSNAEQRRLVAFVLAGIAFLVFAGIVAAIVITLLAAP